MRVFFIYTTFEVQSLRRPLRSFQDIHLGLSQISACLWAAGHETRLAVLCSQMPRQSLKMLGELIPAFDPDIIAFTAVSTQYPFVRTLAREIRRLYPNHLLMIGGVHASLNPEEVIQDDFDVVCIGEGEQPMIELCAQLTAERSVGQRTSHLISKKTSAGFPVACHGAEGAP